MFDAASALKSACSCKKPIRTVAFRFAGADSPVNTSSRNSFVVFSTPSPGPTFETYKVKRGDTLNSIAKKYKTTARSISWWNRGRYPSLDPEAIGYDPGTIRVGWTLVVLRGVVVDDSNPPTPSPAPEAPGETPAAS